MSDVSSGGSLKRSRNARPAAIDKVGTVLMLSADEVLYRQGETADSLYFLDSGAVTIDVGSAVVEQAIIAVHGPGIFFGARSFARLASGGARAESLWVPPGYSSNVEEIALPLMPYFLKDHNQAYEEGVIVGRLFAGYGELEMAMCACIIEETRG